MPSIKQVAMVAQIVDGAVDGLEHHARHAAHRRAAWPGAVRLPRSNITLPWMSVKSGQAVPALALPFPLPLVLL